jgi:DNA polymerase III delta prime subunit
MTQISNNNVKPVAGGSPFAGESHLSALFDLFNDDKLAPSYVLYGQENAPIYEQTFQLAVYILSRNPKNPHGFPLESTTKFLSQGTHPNFFLLTPSEHGKDILIENARDLTVFLQKTPAIPGWRVIIINPAERLNNAASNALLKSIEELPTNTTIFLVAEGLSRVKATILSRSQKIFFQTRRLSTNDYIAKHPESKAMIAAINQALREQKTDKQYIEAISANDESVLLLKKIALMHLHDLAMASISKQNQTNSRWYVKKYDQVSSFISSSENKALPPSFIVESIFLKLREPR